MTSLLKLMLQEQVKFIQNNWDTLQATAQFIDGNQDVIEGTVQAYDYAQPHFDQINQLVASVKDTGLLGEDKQPARKQIATSEQDVILSEDEEEKTAVSSNTPNEIDPISFENLTLSQIRLLCYIVAANGDSHISEGGYISLLIDEAAFQAPHFKNKAHFPEDMEAFCKAGLLVCDHSKPTPTYKISEAIYETVRTLIWSRKAQELIYREDTAGKQLTRFGWGKWKADFEVLDASLQLVSGKYKIPSYDTRAFKFTISYLKDFDDPP